MPRTTEAPEMGAADAVSRRGIARIANSGDLDYVAAQELDTRLDSALQDEQNACVILDLSRTRYLDSTGMALLVRYRQLAAHIGKTFILCQPTPEVRRSLRLTRLDILFQITDTLAEAEHLGSNGGIRLTAVP